MEASPLWGWQANPLLSHFAFPGAIVQQVWGSRCGRPANGWRGWLSIYSRGVAKVRKTYALYHNYLHEEAKKGYSCRRLSFWGEHRVQYLRKTLLFGKSDACLGPGSRTSTGNFLAWYGPQTITYYWLSMWVAMRSQNRVEVQSQEICPKGLGTVGKGIWSPGYFLN